MDPAPVPLTSSVLLAAAGGDAVFNLNHRGKQLSLPEWLVVTHAGAAVIGFILPVAATWAARAS